MVEKGTIIEVLKENLLQLLFPPTCCGCGQPLADTDSPHWCRSCTSQVAYLTSPLCPICGMGLSRNAGYDDRWCRSCLKRRPPFDTARSLVHYGDPIRTLLHRLKFNADTRVTNGLASIVKAGRSCFARKDYDLVVPVPLFPVRLKRRGLNQALVLARIFFAEETDKIDPTVLIKAKTQLRKVVSAALPEGKIWLAQ